MVMNYLSILAIFLSYLVRQDTLKQILVLVLTTRLAKEKLGQVCPDELHVSSFTTDNTCGPRSVK